MWKTKGLMGSFMVFTEQGAWRVRRDADLLSCGEHLETFSRRKLRFDGLVNISTAGLGDGIGALMWMGPAPVRAAPAAGTLPSSASHPLCSRAQPEETLAASPAPPGPAPRGSLQVLLYLRGAEEHDVRPAKNPRCCLAPVLCHRNH